MPSADLHALVQHQARLIRALGTGNIAALEQATTHVARALDRLRASAFDAPQDLRLLDLAQRQAERALFRVNFLTDQMAFPDRSFDTAAS